MDILQNIQSIPPAPQCSFVISPLGPSFSYTVAGHTYNAQVYNEVFTNYNLTFTGSVVIPDGISILQYYWNMGDGTELYGPIVSHLYKIETPEIRVSFCITDNYRRTICTGKLLNLRAGTPISISGYVLQP